MHLHFRNVNGAFQGLVAAIHKGRIPTYKSSSRVGDVIMVDESVTITYDHPRERVLFNKARDCNPFFHLFEALWMLAGRNDVEPLLYYNPRMKEYSDDGKTLHGAYGYRWRKRFGWDQLKGIVRELMDNSNSRRCVLSMWNSCFHDDDEPGGAGDMEMVLNGPAKDVPCNTHAYFAISDGNSGKRLNMTVCNRSNDLVWGMLGANVVHFSMLQEYMAACIGVDVGVYNQFTNNLHAYVEQWKPEEWLAEYAGVGPQPLNYGQGIPYLTSPDNDPNSLVKDPKVFDEECARFIDCIDGDFTEPFLHYIAQPMMVAFRAHKQRRYYGDNNALTTMERVWSDDWRAAGTNWIKKRQEAWEQKSRQKVRGVGGIEFCSSKYGKGDGPNPYTARELSRLGRVDDELGDHRAEEASTDED